LQLNPGDVIILSSTGCDQLAGERSDRALLETKEAMGEPKPSQGNILVVGDQPASLEVLTTMLTRQGHQVQSVISGELAVPTARKLLPDLILLGGDGDNVDGYEVCKRLKADDQTCDIPVIFVEPQDRVRAFASGGADYVTRPFHAEEVLARVQTHLALNATRQQLEDKDKRLQHEIAERLRVEEALHVAEAQGRDLVENLSDVIYTVDADGIVTYVSPAIESFIGYSPSEVTSRRFREFIYEGDLGRHGENFQRILSGHSAANEYRVVTRSGEIRWMRTSSQPVFEGDAVTGVQGVLTDITEQKQAEERTREQNEFLTRVLESLTYPFYVVDANDYTIQIANTAARLDSLSGEATCYALTHARSRPCSTADHPCPLEEIKRTKAPVTVEHVHYGPGGDVRHVEVYGYPLFDNEGEVVRVIEYTLDITERKEAEAALDKLARDLGERVKELDCLYGISRLAGRQDVSLEEILQGTVDLMPPGWQYPDVTCARIVLDRQEFRTQNFQETEWRLATDLVVHGERIGMVEVHYLEERPAGHEGPFLREERRLIDSVAERLGRITERRRAEEALRESEARWRSFTENSPDHVIILDTDLRIQFLNYASPGLTVEELIGTPLYTLVQEERQPEVKGILENVLKTGEPARYETEYRSQEGSTLYYESRVVPRMLDDQVLGLAVNARDITERKETEQALQAAMEAAQQARRQERERRQEAERHLQIAKSLADVLAALNSNQPLETILDHIAAVAGQLLNNQAVAICSLQSEPGTWAIEAAQGLPEDCKACGDMPLGQDALQRTVASRQPVLVPDIAAALAGEGPLVLDPQRPLSKGPSAGLYRALLAVPILAKDEVYGGIVLYYAEPQAFTGGEVELAKVFGDQVALAVENARLRERVQQAAVNAERSRLARDLHDSVTQALFSASLVAEVLPQVWRRDPEEALQGVDELRLLTRGALSEMRTMLLELRPTAVVETRLDDLLRQLTEAITGRTQLAVTVDLEPVPALPPEAHVTFYRVAQEALHNAVKHAGASQVLVSLRASPPISPQPPGEWQGQVILQVSDDGRGFDPSCIGPGQLGVVIMRERAEAVGAVLVIEGQPGQGTQVTLVWQKP
jgi:PAS domain S-box-containing protein